MDLAKLKAEITNDPQALGYLGKTDEQVCNLLNAETRSRHIELLSPSRILNSLVYSEFTTKTAAQQQLIWNVLHLGDINPWGVEATIFIAVFGAGSATIAALAAMRVEAISRSTELGIGRVEPGEIVEARAFGG